jgi:hypothetical protein
LELPKKKSKSKRSSELESSKSSKKRRRADKDNDSSYKKSEKSKKKNSRKKDDDDDVKLENLGKLPELPPSLSSIPIVENTEPEPAEFDEPTWAPVDDEPDVDADESENVKDLEGSLFGERSNESPLPPLSQVQINSLAMEVKGLIEKGTTELPSLEDNESTTDGTARKCAWWFAKNDKEPPPCEESKLQELEPPPSSFNSECGSGHSFEGNVSSYGLDEECQVHEISSTSRYDNPAGRKERDPDKIDEYCVSNPFHR